jgi:hypothetical protein
LKHKKEKEKSQMTYRLRQGAGDLSLAQKPQMAAPRRRKTEQGAEVSDSCAMAQGNGTGARKKKPINCNLFQKRGLQNLTAKELFFGSDSEVLQRYFKCGNSFQP